MIHSNVRNIKNGGGGQPTDAVKIGSLFYVGNGETNYSIHFPHHPLLVHIWVQDIDELLALNNNDVWIDTLCNSFPIITDDGLSDSASIMMQGNDLLIDTHTNPYLNDIGATYVVTYFYI